MILDVNSPLAGESIDRSAPWESYYVGYVNRTFAVVEAFKNYPNTMMFFSGNEVINDLPTGKTVPPYMRVSQTLPKHLPCTNLSRLSLETSRTMLQRIVTERSLWDTALQMSARFFLTPGTTFSVPRLEMYNIIKLPKYSSHKLKISSNSDELAIFAFTFGSYITEPNVNR